VAHGFWLLTTHDQKQEMVIQLLFPVTHGVSVIPGFMPKLITHRMHDLGLIVPHIQPKVLTDNQMS
jgi:hypothetical protein